MKTWMDGLNSLMFAEEKNIDDLAKENSRAKNNDVGVINSVSGAGILARENGMLEGFAHYNLGFRFDPSHMSLSLFAPRIQLFCNEFKVYDGEDPGKFDPINKDYQEILDLIGGGKP
jgi:hypothetical protein